MSVTFAGWQGKAGGQGETCPISEQPGVPRHRHPPTHPPLLARLTLLSTSFVKGLLVVQLHHFFCSCGMGARKSWKVRALHVRCLGQWLSRWTFPFSAASAPAAGWLEVSQSDTEAGLVMLLFRFLSWKEWIKILYSIFHQKVFKTL